MRCTSPLSVGFPSRTVPCGKCISCRVNRTNDWAVRIMHEAVSCSSSYITLTYNDDNLPENGTLVKSDFQNFMKLLRRRLDVKVRFFGSGEYGDQFSRPHYHIIILGYDFPDKYLFKMYKGKPLYRSPFLEGVWTKGFSTVEDVSIESARYCAKYTVKYLTGERANVYKDKKIIPEFSLQSRRPGLGYDMASRNVEIFKNNNFIFLGGKRYPIPRYYRKKFFTDIENNERQKIAVDEEIKKVLTFDNKYGKDYYKDKEERLKAQAQFNRSKLKNRKQGGGIND